MGGWTRASLLLGIFVGGITVSACRSDETRAVRAFCKAFRDCQEENFDAEFDSIKDCQEESQSALDQAERDNGPECKEAFTLAIECAADVNADTCDFDAVVEECGDQIFDALEKCPDFDLGSLELGI